MTSSGNQALFTYSIDAQDRIIQVSDNWNVFALDNQGESSVDTNILERSLWDFIADAETVILYQALVGKVREQMEEVSFSFRCDSPGKRRFMRMRIEPANAADVLFHSLIEQEEPRVNLSVLDPAAERDNSMLLICSWCKSIKCGSRWLATEDALQELGLMKRRILPKLSHGICRPCADKISEQLAG